MEVPNLKPATTGNRNQVKTVGKKYMLTQAIMVKDQWDSTFKNSYPSIAETEIYFW